jgi:hypothetical protein
VEGRLRLAPTASGNTTYLTNFSPTRPLAQIAREFVDALERLYEPRAYLDRAWRYFHRLGAQRAAERRERAPVPAVRESLRTLHVFSRVLWRQGVRRSTRWRFWRYLLGMLRHDRRLIVQYVTVCVLNEHFLRFRQEVRRDIDAQLHAMANLERVARRTAAGSRGVGPIAVV